MHIRAPILAAAFVAASILPAGTAERPAADWTYALVVMVETPQAGKHTATVAGPGQSGALAMDGRRCASAMKALIAAGTSAACVPAGVDTFIHSEN